MSMDRTGHPDRLSLSGLNRTGQGLLKPDDATLSSEIKTQWPLGEKFEFPNMQISCFFFQYKYKRYKYLSNEMMSYHVGFLLNLVLNMYDSVFEYQPNKMCT